MHKAMWDELEHALQEDRNEQGVLFMEAIAARYAALPPADIADRIARLQKALAVGLAVVWNDGIIPIDALIGTREALDRIIGEASQLIVAIQQL